MESDLVLPLMGVLAALGAFAARRTLATKAALLMLLALVIEILAYDWMFSSGTLQTQYYVSWLLPLAFIGIAAALASTVCSIRIAAFVATAVVLLQGSTLDNAAHLTRNVVTARMGLGSPRAAEEMTAIVVLLLTFAASYAAKRRFPAVALVFTLVVADFVVTPNLPFVASHGPSQFEATQQMFAFLRAHVPRTSRPLFWIARGKNGAHFNSLASTHLYLYSLVSDTYPHLPDDVRESSRVGTFVRPFDYVVVGADTAADPALVNREFQRVGLHAIVLASTAVNTGDSSFVLTLLRVLP
jgi:hypothetical protein